MNIDKNQFEKLCSILCTQKEIASFFDVSVNKLETWCKATYKKNFKEAYEELSAVGKISLRRYQFRLAETSTPMAIFLGKQMLGQREVVENKVSNQIQIVADIPHTTKPRKTNNKVSDN